MLVLTLAIDVSRDIHKAYQRHNTDSIRIHMHMYVHTIHVCTRMHVHTPFFNIVADQCSVHSICSVVDILCHIDVCMDMCTCC